MLGTCPDKLNSLSLWGLIRLPSAYRPLTKHMNDSFLLKTLIHLTVIVLVLLLALGWLGSSTAIDSFCWEQALFHTRKYVGRLNRPVNDNLRPQLLPRSVSAEACLPAPLSDTKRDKKSRVGLYSISHKEQHPRLGLP